MTENIPVVCITERYWDTEEKTFCGTEKNGMLIEITTQSAEDNPSVTEPVGVVLFEDNTFESIPLKFITKKV